MKLTKQEKIINPEPIKINLAPLFHRLQEQSLLSRKERLYRKEAELLVKKEESPEEILYKITFPPSNDILLNNLMVLSKPNLNSENAEIFSYLIEHPNKEVTKEEIEKALDRKINKSFHKILQNMGFKKDLRKIFFTVSKSNIIFRNPITFATFKQLGISPLRFPTK